MAAKPEPTCSLMMALDLVDVPALVVDTDPPHDACAGGSNTRGAE